MSQPRDFLGTWDRHKDNCDDWALISRPYPDQPPPTSIKKEPKKRNPTVFWLLWQRQPGPVAQSVALCNTVTAGHV